MGDKLERLLAHIVEVALQSNAMSVLDNHCLDWHEQRVI